MITLDPKTTERPELFKQMLSAIGPRPIALASTMDREGIPNLSPFSFFNIFGINPPTLIFSPSRSGRDASTKDTYDNVKALPETVINVVTYSMVQQTNLSSTAFPKEINEFEKAGFTALDSDLVRPPRVKESPVQIECKVINVIETGTGGGAGNLVICEILKVHVDENMLDDKGIIDTRKLELVGRMGGNYWVKAFGDALFEVQKPTGHNALGVDQIPLDIRLSEVLSGNDLGQLGMVKSLPAEDAVKEEKKDKTLASIYKKETNPEKLKEILHQKAKDSIKQGDIDKAWRILLSFYIV